MNQMIEGKIYVDDKGGPDVWFGLFKYISGGICYKLIYFGWQVFGSEVINDNCSSNNHGPWRLATHEDLLRINCILDNLGYKLDKDNNLYLVYPKDINKFINKINKSDEFSKSERSFLIKAIKYYGKEV